MYMLALNLSVAQAVFELMIFLPLLPKLDLGLQVCIIKFYYPTVILEKDY